MACFSGRVCTNAVSIFSLPLLKFSIGGRSAFLGVELQLTHAVTHEQKGAESTGQGQTGFFLSGPVFFCCTYRICWLMTPPMVSAASCFIWAVAWV